jgi:Na+-translocating ferredoxin:NAD+ oxidoreductase RnfG subunit
MPCKENQKYKGWKAISSVALSVLAVQPVIFPVLSIKEAAAFIGRQNLQFLSLTAAQKATFPQAVKFTEFSLDLNDDILKQIADKTDVSNQSQNKETKAWKAINSKGKLLGYFLVDKVYGKHELITYSTGIDKSGAVTHVEILDYKETYGGQVDGKEWRDQFIGKKSTDKLVLDEDIKNISGATLSCKHITNGVKRMLALYEILLRNKT